MDPSLLDKTEIYYGSKEACWVRVGLQIKEKTNSVVGTFKIAR